MKPELHKSERGFTLIEVLIALMILAFTMTVLMESWGGNLRGLKKSRNYTTVVMLLQKKLTEFEVAHKDRPIDEIAELTQGDFGKEYPDFTWEIKSRPFDMPNILGNDKTTKDNTLTQTIVKTLQEYFKKAVKEVAVTVIYKSGKKELKYSVTTLIVDYNKELPLGF